MFPADNGYYYYIINSKLGFLAETDVRFVITAKEDFRRFRMIAASMQSQWSGAELFKNGVAVTARITDKENMAEFDPNSKADNVISNVSDVLVTTCQHSEPVFEFSPVDANNDDGGGNLPDPDKSQYAKYVYEITSRTGGSSVDGFQFGTIAISTTNASTIKQTRVVKIPGQKGTRETQLLKLNQLIKQTKEGIEAIKQNMVKTFQFCRTTFINIER